VLRHYYTTAVKNIKAIFSEAKIRSKNYKIIQRLEVY
jgi:hypothetical protein